MYSLQYFYTCTVDQDYQLRPLKKRIDIPSLSLSGLLIYCKVLHGMESVLFCHILHRCNP
jgi:hypothetical protein